MNGCELSEICKRVAIAHGFTSVPIDIFLADPSPKNAHALAELIEMIRLQLPSQIEYAQKCKSIQNGTCWLDPRNTKLDPEVVKCLIEIYK